MSRRDQIKLSDGSWRTFLDEQRVVICATNGVRGWPHLMPLWYVVREGEIWAWTYAKSQKVRNLERDPRATLQIEDGEQYDELRGVMIEARRRAASGPRRGREARARSCSPRYGGGGVTAGDRRGGRARRPAKRVALQFVPQRIDQLGSPQARWQSTSLRACRYAPARMRELKGLILSGGKGTRLRPITHTSAKQLVPVANKPVLFYGIEAMAQAGIEEVGIIIAPETGDEIRAAAGDGSALRRQAHLHRPGRAARPRARGADRRAVPRRLAVRHVPRRQPAAGRDRGSRGRVPRAAPDALILLTPVPDPEHYGVAELSDGAVVRLVEKPAEPKTNLALVGVYMFTSAVHAAARAIEPSARGELEITDAIQHLVDQGLRVEPHIVKGWWKDTGRSRTCSPPTGSCSTRSSGGSRAS